MRSERGNEFVWEYKKACKEGSRELKFFRLVIVGAEEAGKTCLLKALKGQHFDENKISTNFIETTGITIIDPNRDWNESINSTEQLQIEAKIALKTESLKSPDAIDPIDFFTVWDLAEQSYLFCMHSLFLSPRAVYIVTVDLTKRLDEQVVVREERLDRIQKREISVSYLEMIKYWIQTIYSVARSTENEECKSRIIIVFTKSDEIADPQAIADSYFKEIRDSLFWKSNCMSIVDKKFHVVSAKVREQEEMKMLKKAINENATLTCFDFDLPIRWLDLALKILGDSNPVMGERELKDIADKTGCGMDYEQILEFFHSIGMFFFRKNILVKSLSDLLNVILHIVLPKYCKYFPQINQRIERAKKEAILSDDILDAILGQNNLLRVKTEIVQLLKEFGIIINRNSEEYYVPYLFNEVITIEPRDKDLILYLYFPDGLVPTSFYFALLSSISDYDKTKESPNHFIFGFDCVEFQWENLTWIIDLSDHKPYIRIILRGIDFMNSCPDIHSLIFQLEQWTAHIQRELILSGKIAQIVLECPCKKFSEKRRPCVYFKDYLTHSVDETHFYCRYKKKYISWAIYNNKLHHPFKSIPRELGEKFVKFNRNQILKMLKVDPLLRTLHKKGLISGEETNRIRKLNKSEKAAFLVDNISNRRNDWAYQFYKILKKDDNQSNVKVRELYESFILNFKHSEIPEEDINFIRYPIHNNPCGICLIINMQTFSGGISEREGSKIDVSNLRNTFDNLSFKTVVFQDYSKSNLHRELKTLSANYHKDYDVFFCVIMSHGNEKNEICTTDNEVININEIQDYFKPKNCPSLRGKPKIFIIQACRGEATDRGQPDPHSKSLPPDAPVPAATYGSQGNSDSPPPETDEERVESGVDFYIAHAPASEHEGSIFISTFCTVLQAEKFNHHFTEIMTEVGRRVTNNEVKKANEVFFQCPEAIDRLRKRLFLF